MAYQEEKKVNSAEYWYFILPACILLLLGFFVYVLFRMSSIQTVESRKILQIVKHLSPNKLSQYTR